MIAPGSFVIVHLTNPVERFWGVLHELGSLGLSVSGIALDGFEDWIAQVQRHDIHVGLSTSFVPLFRVERIYLDRQVGEVESYCQRFEHRVGLPPWIYLGVGTQPDDHEADAS